MQLKHHSDIVSDDLDKIEDPFFACQKVRGCFVNPADWVRGTDQILSGLGFDRRQYTSSTLLEHVIRLIENGEWFLVHGVSSKPLSPVVGAELEGQSQDGAKIAENRSAFFLASIQGVLNRINSKIVGFVSESGVESEANMQSVGKPAGLSSRIKNSEDTEHVVPSEVSDVDLPKDLVPDSKGVYGYLPTEDSQFHSTKWPVDWKDTEQVSSARGTRLEYHDGLKSKQQFVDTLRSDGVGDDSIARQLVEMRNQDRLSHYKTPEALEVVYKRNLTKYGNKYGPTYESQLMKYGTSTEVINAAFKSNRTMDILTGIAKPKGNL